MLNPIRTKRILLVVCIILLPILVLAQNDDNLPLYSLPNANFNRPYSTSSIAITQNARLLVTANMLNDTVSIIQPSPGRLLAEIPVGDDPRIVATTVGDGNAKILVTNRGDGTLSVIDLVTFEWLATYPVGVLPYGVVTDNNQTAFVALQGSNEVIEINILNGEIQKRIPTPTSPVGLTLWGDFLYVTHLWSGDISLIYIPQERVVRTISTGEQTNLSAFMGIDVNSGLAYIPQNLSNSQENYPTFDNTILPIISVIDLETLAVLPDARIGLTIADRPVNMPFTIAVDRFRQWLYVVNSGSNDLSVIDLNTGFARAHIKVGSNPRGVVLSPDRNFAYVHNMIDGTLTIIDTGDFDVIDVVPISNLTIPIDQFIGAQLFHDAENRLMSANHTLSCANCHFDGQSDGRTWQGINTPALYELVQTAPYGVVGLWDELADVEVHIRAVQKGEGLLPELEQVNPSETLTTLSLDLDALTSYLAFIQTPINPTQDSVSGRGQEIFDQFECVTCHIGYYGTDNLFHDVGTGREVQTPPLRSLWLTEPYFHDGSAESLSEIFIRQGTHQLTAELSPEEIDLLVEYLRNLP